uniref:NADH-plastoquinone oxidoreductase subunit 2 n=1 Tax=Gymnosphaera podophylla TaxID=204585 RepID=A0A344AIK3_9MONI|nr:NADH-plastoquinone oxidoreductase subunit 2 [Alsophila podophylla]AWV63344.1 NADH-plastoquinone oxidoreductase subunit 2 [Alsophila podophylla]
MSGKIENLLFDSNSPTPVVAFFSATSKVAALALSTRLFGIIFPYFSGEWHIALGVLATLSMILGNLIAITQISMKRMLAYSSISQIGYIMIGILAADPENGYASMITYTFIHILMNLGTFARITSFGLRTGTDNIRDYTNNIDYFLSLCNSSIFPEYILILTLITIIVIDLSYKGKDILLLHRISLISLLSSIVLLLCQWEVKSVPIAPESLQINTPSNIFRLFLLIRSLLSVSLSVDYVRCTKIALAEFLLFISTAGSGGMLLRCANDLVTIYVASECLSLSSYLLSGYAKKDIRSNEATLKFLLMGGASSSFLAYGFSLLYGLSGGEVQLNKLVDGLLSNQMCDSVAIYTSIAFVVAGMAFKLSLVPFHQWTPDVYEGAGLYMKDPVLTFSPVLRSPSLGGIPPPSGFFGKLYLFWHGWKAGSYPSVPIALVTSVISIYYYLKIIKLMFTGKNERSGTSTIYIQNSLVSSSTSISKSSIEIAMIIRALASILSGILIDPIIGITQNTLF